MNKQHTKISLFTAIAVLLLSCNAVKRVPPGEHLLTENQIFLNEEELNDARINTLLYQQPNARLPLVGIPLRLHIYNLAEKNPDSVYTAWLNRKPKRKERLTNLISAKQVERMGDIKVGINNAIKKAGEPPTIVSESRTKRSADRLTAYYQANGWFNAETDYEIERDSTKRAQVKYQINTGKPYAIDSLTTFIESQAADSIYSAHREESYIVPGQQYRLLDINAETSRITNLFKNNGLYHFDREFISFLGDSVNTGHKANIELYIRDRQVEQGDTLVTIPFQVHEISRVNVITDYTYADREANINDSLTREQIHLYAFDKINYRAQAITDALSVKPGSIYSEQDRIQTLTRLGELRTFKYPSISYKTDPNDSTGKDLIANILLTPLAKYSLKAEFSASTSNIQDFGIAGSGSLLIRNIFRGAETFQISARGSIGASDDLATAGDSFFNIREIGADLSLTFPRIFFPFDTRRLITSNMSPSTQLNVGIGVQENIGLDKQNVTGGLRYLWSPTRVTSFRLDLIDIQYVRNLNTQNYFNIYNNSYELLNEIALEVPTDDIPGNDVFDRSNFNENNELIIPTGTRSFIDLIGDENPQGLNNTQLRDLRSIEQRRQRLTEDNLILATNAVFIRNNRENLFDPSFSRFRVKLELAGNLLDAISSVANLERTPEGNSKVFGVQFSQYIKTEIDYIKHWEVGPDIFAIRTFGGIAVPYGNSNSIPFIRSFFAGGSNDNRAWQAYRLGPGSTDSPNEFNEANMKLAFNAEYRFTVLGDLKGAVFADIGNIWNIADNVEDPAARFEGFADLKELAIGSGFGLRYDFGFFVFRFDLGFKTYNPAEEPGDRWFRQYNFANTVLNFGINYPF
ncbi:translocation and assembly module lipoprotein TamL [Croceiramulus getboli]|nr:BamA/TamA family outer membrane protein [Flavobacteriaceae bacterium YJPT1-3]